MSQIPVLINYCETKSWGLFYAIKLSVCDLYKNSTQTKEQKDILNFIPSILPKVFLFYKFLCSYETCISMLCLQVEQRQSMCRL